MNIPTQYYEEDFLQFEEYLEKIGDTKIATPDNIHANSEYTLRRYAHYEKYRRREDKKLRRQQRNKQGRRQSRRNFQKGPSGQVDENQVAVSGRPSKNPLKCDKMNDPDETGDIAVDVTMQNEVNK